MTAQVSFSTAGHLDSSLHHPGKTHQGQTSASNGLHIQLMDSPPPSPGLHSHRQNHNPSKLPTFRLADLTKTPSSSPTEPSQESLPSLVQQQNAHGPLSPVSPDAVPAAGGSSSKPADPGPGSLPNPGPANGQNPQSTTHPAEKQAVTASATAPDAALTSTIAASASSSPTQPRSIATITSPPKTRSRASTLEPSSSPTPVDLPTQARRPASFPDTPSSVAVALSPRSTSATAKSRTQRSWASPRSNVTAASTGPPFAHNLEHLQADEAAPASQSSADRPTKDSPHGQRELILPKSLSKTSPTDERRSSYSHRPPVSYRPPNNTQSTTSTPVRVPPIRAFRSSGSRRSLVLDMNSRTRPYDMDDLADPNHDRTLQALEGRVDQDFLHMTAAASARHDVLDGDDTGDVFMRIARQEPSQRATDETFPSESHSVVSRMMRSSHRRPLSSTVLPYNPTSPPRITRRLSDQQDASRMRASNDDRTSEVSRPSHYRTRSRENGPPIQSGDDTIRARPSGSASRPSITTPRSNTFQEPEPSNSGHTRRRSSITDNTSTSQQRNPIYKSSAYAPGHNKAHSSAPPVRSFDLQRPQITEPSHGREGTESTTSTNAPSTVWDELDDLKSRIHRLELTGKMPATSGAAISRLSDERPPTATTTVTTMSSSPKRPGGGAQPTEAASTTSAQREAHPILQAALAKSKLMLNTEVYRALESAATDAMALSSMMGTSGQLGPISSGASAIGSGTNITDRQLRRKADSVCRSLTELCLALGEAGGQSRSNPVTQTITAAPLLNESPITPLANKSVLGLSSQRRPTAMVEPVSARSNLSPRAVSKFEERRINLISGAALPTPRITNSTPSTPLEASSHRRSSLMISRNRRAGTEEPEDGRGSSLLRTRRAGTEEPEEGRKTSLLVRSRRGTVGDEEDEARFRAPSRAQTDLTTARDVTHDLSQTTAPSGRPMASSAIPRRRFASSSLNNVSRLTTPLTSNTTPPRRYFERSTPDRDGNSLVDKLAEDRGQRQMSFGQTMSLNRTGSLNRRSARHSSVSTVPTPSVVGGYR